jgi:hypothetical protein
MQRARAEDADPEELAEAAMEIGKHQEPPAQSAEDRVAADRKARHDAFDRLMDGKATDADINALSEWLKEESTEPEHQADTTELEETLASDAGAECPECGEAGDACTCPPAADAESEDPQEAEEEEETGAEERTEVGARAADGSVRLRIREALPSRHERARASDAVRGAQEVLKLWRPYAAKAKDGSPEQAAFNAALRAVTRSSRASSGGYDAVVRVARARDGVRRAPVTARARAADAGGVSPIEKLQQYYNDAHSGKGVK